MMLTRAVGELRLQTGTLTSLIAEIRNEAYKQKSFRLNVF